MFSLKKHRYRSKSNIRLELIFECKHICIVFGATVKQGQNVFHYVAIVNDFNQSLCSTLCVFGATYYRPIDTTIIVLVVLHTPTEKTVDRKFLESV